MSRLSRLRPFDDQSAHLDRFGWVLVLSMVSIIALALVDVTGSSDHALAAAASVATTLLLGVTLMPALRASGVARRWQRVADVIVGLVVAGLVFLVVAVLVVEVSATSIDESSHPLTLVVLAALAPLVVIRRLLHLTAVTPFARLIATAEALSGQVYLVTFVAMLVGLRAQAWASGRKEARAAEPAEGTTTQ